MEGQNNLWGREKIQNRRKDYSKDFTNFLILDIETIRDTQMIDDIHDQKILKKLEEDENYFIPHPYHRIVAVSIMSIKMPDGDTIFKSFASEDEKRLLELFWEYYLKAHSFGVYKTQNGDRKKAISRFPVLITVNGKDFDLPVIKLRSLKYIPDFPDHKKFIISTYLDRFDKWENDYPRYTMHHTKFHIDIPIDIFNKKISLKNLCYLCGIPVKQEGDGSKVQDYFDNGELEKIAKYCAEDVKATALLFAYINKHLLYETYLFPDMEFIKSLDGDIQVL